ncbi:Ent-kaurene oxidase-like protein [Paramyrothecium foliicola]|nr:Ent-kaurene oxidase-like protein [Paramyrothecium foliicola]
MIVEELPIQALAIKAIPVILIIWLLQRLFTTDPLAKVPWVGHDKKTLISGGEWGVYAEGYKKFKNSVFRVSTMRESPTVVVSKDFLPQLDKLPNETLSFDAAMNESIHAKHLGLPHEAPVLPFIIKTSLTPALARLSQSISADVTEALHLELPQNTQWSEVKINDKLLRIIAMVTGHAFVGPELCRNEVYLDAAVNYSVEVIAAAYAVGTYPVWLRPVVSRFLPKVKIISTRLRDLEKLIGPVIKARKEAAEDPAYQKTEDLLQWLIDAPTRFGELSDLDIARNQLEMTRASIYTTTLASVNALYCIAADPDLARTLREEVRLALAESDGQYTFLAVQNMKKLDSFLKEVMRYYPMTAAILKRKVLKTFTLPNGQIMPQGATLEVNTNGVHFDPEIIADPEVFDPLRFYKLRTGKDPEKGAKSVRVTASSLMVGTGESSLAFGYGRHACPGRFFAAIEAKTVIATILMNYELKNSNGEVGRYPNIKIGATQFPDPSKTVLIRSVE